MKIVLAILATVAISSCTLSKEDWKTLFQDTGSAALRGALKEGVPAAVDSYNRLSAPEIDTTATK